MVEKFRKIKNKIVKYKGNVNLFAILRMDEYINKWSVIISADWISDKNKSEVFRYLRKLIIEEFDKREISQIARIGIFNKQDSLVRELSKHEKDYLISESIKINGSVVHAGYIFSTND